MPVIYRVHLVTTNRPRLKLVVLSVISSVFIIRLLYDLSLVNKFGIVFCTRDILSAIC